MAKKTGRKKPSRKTLVKKLDKIVSLYIRLRDEVCVVCGTNEKLTNGHLFSRYSYSTRWDISEDGNCHTQCWGCNYRHEYDPYPYTNWFIEKFGKERWDEVHRDFKGSKRYSNSQLQELYDEIKELHDQLYESKKYQF